MNKNVPLLYGYAVCLVSIIVTFISISMIVGSLFSLQDPLRSSSPFFFGPSASLSSFESYKIDILTGRADAMPTGDQKPADRYTPSDAELRAAYESAKEDRTASVNLEAKKSISNGVILILVALAFFVTHWRWLSRFNKA